MRDLVVLFRGVNVGGANKLPMAALRAACMAEGFARPETYIASGNLIFGTDWPRNDVKFKLARLLSDQFGLTVTTLILEGDDIRNILANCPFPEAAGNKLHGLICVRLPVIDAEAYADIRSPNEEITPRDTTVWVHTPDGFGTSKLATKLGKVITGTDFTARNLNTIRKLVEMLDERAQAC